MAYVLKFTAPNGTVKYARERGLTCTLEAAESFTYSAAVFMKPAYEAAYKGAWTIEGRV